MLVAILILVALVPAFVFVNKRRKPVSDRRGGFEDRTAPMIEKNFKTRTEPGSKTAVNRDDRDRLITAYIDMVESSPVGSGIGPHMTPREVSSSIPVGSRNTLGSFESRVYDPRSREETGPIVKGLIGIKNWILEKFGGGA